MILWYRWGQIRQKADVGIISKSGVALSMFVLLGLLVINQTSVQVLTLLLSRFVA